MPKLPDLAHWAADNGFGAIDIGGPDKEAVEAVRGAGLEVGTFDLMASNRFPAFARTRSSGGGEVIPVIADRAAIAPET